MRKAFAIRYDRTFAVVELHEMSLPDLDEKFGYAQFSSLTGFWRRETARCARSIRRHQGRLPEFHYEPLWGPSWELALLNNPDLETMPRQVHEDVWAFYRAIRYDHKRNKFNPEEPTNV